jgi:hypothetical protein
MDAAELRGFALDDYRDGDSRLLILDHGGQFEEPTKDGPVMVPYYAGDAVLARKDGTVICGPVGPAGAVALAESVLEGDQRTITDPRALLVLAAAVVAFLDTYLPAPAAPEAKQGATA